MLAAAFSQCLKFAFCSTPAVLSEPRVVLQEVAMVDEDICSKFEEYRAQANARCSAAGCGDAESCSGSALCPANASAPIIGVVPTQYPSEKSVVMANRYISALAAAGAAPLILPLVEDVRVYETLFPKIDGFLLTGGNDIDPERYGSFEKSEKLGELTPEREDLEFLILSYAYQFDVPVLGICRGMQMINVFFGGTLYLDLADQFTPVQHWQTCDYAQTSHFVKIVRESKLGRILETDRLATNSMHHQGVRTVAPLLDPVAYGPDGLVEAIEVRDRSFIVGVQWHPEFFAGEKKMGCIFTSLAQEAIRSHAATCQERERCRLSIRKAESVRSWPTMEYADGI